MDAEHERTEPEEGKPLAVPFENHRGDLRYQPQLPTGERRYQGLSRRMWLNPLSSVLSQPELAVLYRTKTGAQRDARREMRRRDRARGKTFWEKNSEW